MSKYRLTTTTAALALAMSAISVQAAPVNLLQNGGFEDNEVTAPQGWQIFADIDGWDVGLPPSNGVEIRLNNIQGDAQEGKQFAELDTTVNSSISQSIAVSEFTAPQYQLSFYYSPRINRNVPATDNQIDVFWNDELLESLTGTNTTGAHMWKLYTFLLSGDDLRSEGFNVLRFAAGGASNSFGGSLDNVSLTATPLPGAALLFGTSIAGFLAARKRRKAAALAA